jgi:hypothetical protein
MQIVVGANRLPKYWINILLFYTALHYSTLGPPNLGDWLWRAAVECNVKNMYFVQKIVENLEIFV